MIDLWPSDLSTVDQRSPLTILKEQASLLGEKTQNIVIAVLESTPPAGGWRQNNYPFKYGFLLTCPALGNYRFGLFSIAYDIEMYPVSFILDSDLADEILKDIHLVQVSQIPRRFASGPAGEIPPGQSIVKRC